MRFVVFFSRWFVSVMHFVCLLFVGMRAVVFLVCCVLLVALFSLFWLLLLLCVVCVVVGVFVFRLSFLLSAFCCLLSDAVLLMLYVLFECRVCVACFACCVLLIAVVLHFVF